MVVLGSPLLQISDQPFSGTFETPDGLKRQDGVLSKTGISRHAI